MEACGMIQVYLFEASTIKSVLYVGLTHGNDIAVFYYL